MPSLNILAGGYLIFDVVPFILMVITPAFVVPMFVGFFSKNIEDRALQTLLPFSASLILLAVLGNYLWDAFVFRHIYFEWDRIFIPYTFVLHESPLIDNTSSWIVQGFNLRSLDLIWLGMTLSIYLTAGIVTLLFNFKSRFNHQTVRLVVNSVVVLSIISTFFAFV